MYTGSQKLLLVGSTLINDDDVDIHDEELMMKKMIMTMIILIMIMTMVMNFLMNLIGLEHDRAGTD